MRADEQDAPQPKPEPKNFTFRVQGHDQDVPVGTFTAEDEGKAFTQAFRACKGFELPGWRLVCTTTGTSQPVVKAIEYGERGEKKGVRRI
jgi:hypothetical protein